MSVRLTEAERATIGKTVSAWSATRFVCCHCLSAVPTLALNESHGC